MIKMALFCSNDIFKENCMDFKKIKTFFYTAL